MGRSLSSSPARAFLSVVILGAGSLAASGAKAWTHPPELDAPGIPMAGFPAFNNSTVYLDFSKIKGTNDYLLAAAGTAGYFNMSPGNWHAVKNEVFSMYAVFDSSGHFVSGSESIFGSIPGLVNKQQKLYSVTFDKYAVSTSKVVGLGFETVDSTATGWASKFQTGNESLDLYSAALAPLDNALKSGHGLPGSFSAVVKEWTTVPLPASAWLLGSAFAALIAGARRRHRPGLEVLSAPGV